MKWGIRSPLPLSRQVFSHPWHSRAPSLVIVSWEDENHHSTHPPFLFLPLVLLQSMTAHGVGYPSGQVGLAVPVLSSPSSLCIPSLLTCGVTSRKALTVCKHCSAVVKLSMCYQYCFHHKFKTKELPWRKLTLSQPKPVHSLKSTLGTALQLQR